jgi:hypothetical protein
MTAFLSAPQKFLLLWAAARRDEKGSDINVGDLAT